MLHPAIERRADPLPGGARNGKTAPTERAPGNGDEGKRRGPGGAAARSGAGNDFGNDFGTDLDRDSGIEIVRGEAGLDRREAPERPLDSKSLYLGALARRGGAGEQSELPCCVTGRKPEARPGSAVFRCAALRSPGAAPCGLVVAHLRLVVALARRYEHLKKLPLEDLIQEGNVGLLGAVRSYDPERHGRFSRHAATCIRKAICDALTDARPIHIPRAAVALRRRAAGVAGELEQRYGNEACDGGAVHEHRLEDDAAEMGLDPEDLRDNRRAVPEVESLDAPGPAREPAAARLADPRTPDPGDAALEGERRELLREVVSTLPDTWRRVMEQRYGLDGGGGATFAEIGRALSLTPPRVHQIHAKGVKALQGHERLLRARG